MSALNLTPPFIAGRKGEPSGHPRIELEVGMSAVDQTHLGLRALCNDTVNQGETFTATRENVRQLPLIARRSTSDHSLNGSR